MMTPGDFHRLLTTNGTDLESLAAEYRRLWDENERLTRHVTHMQEGGTIVLNQKRAWRAMAKDFLRDVRETHGTIKATTILHHLPLIKDLLDEHMSDMRANDL